MSRVFEMTTTPGQGFVDGFDQFCEAEMAGLARIAAALTGNRESAHDLLADSLVQVHTRWHLVSAATDQLSYVRRVVVNRYISEQRSWTSRHIKLTSRGDLPEKQAGADPLIGVHQRADLELLLRALPRQQRAAVVLRYYLDLPDDRVAVILKCSQATVRSHVSHALAALRISIRSASLEK